MQLARSKVFYSYTNIDTIFSSIESELPRTVLEQFVENGCENVCLISSPRDVQSEGLRNCLPLHILDLSGCALTDASVNIISAIVKVGMLVITFYINQGVLSCIRAAESSVP